MGGGGGGGGCSGGGGLEGVEGCWSGGGGVYVLPSHEMFVFQLKLTPLTELSRIPWIAAPWIAWGMEGGVSCWC